MEFQLAAGAPDFVQLTPLFVEVQMPRGPLLAPVARREPSAEHAIEIQLTAVVRLDCVHVNPPSVEVQTPLLPPAANTVPSAEEARDHQTVVGALVCVHVTPPSLEVQMPPL